MKDTGMSASKYVEFVDKRVKKTEKTIRDFIKRFVDDGRLYNVDIDELIKTVNRGLPNDVSLEEFYNFIADTCIQKQSFDPDYEKLAARILVERIHQSTEESIVAVANTLYNNTTNGIHNPIISEELYHLIVTHGEKIQAQLDFSRDYIFDSFGIRTLERSYLKKVMYKSQKTQKSSMIIVERPQHLLMRVALGIHGKALKYAYETYDLMSNRYFTHATPTLFNAGTPRPQMSSCYLVATEDSLESILNTIKQMGHISKWAGGIGVHLSAIRPRNSLIRGTNGQSEGIVPLCTVLNRLAKYINQGGKRNGSIACYLEPHHGDIFEFCELRKNTGSEDDRARDLFLGLWNSDLFMKRVENDEMWSLMCPDACKGLHLVNSEEYEKLYISYEQKKMYIKQVKARDLWKHILECQIETGFPYMLYKDHCNRKSNQKNLGTIRSSNLCAEIIEYSNSDETAVCFTADTKILTVDGFKPIVECDNVKVVSYFDSDETFEKNVSYERAKLVENGVQDIYGVKMCGRRLMKMTADHPVVVYENKKFVWKKTIELKTGDKMFCPRIKNDMYLQETRVENLDLIKLGSAFAKRKSDYHDLRKYDLNLTDVPKNKIVLSDKIKSLNPSDMANFLSGFFGAIGHVYSLEGEPRLYVDSYSSELLYDIQEQLYPYGILSYVNEHTGTARMEICDYTSVVNFSRFVGMRDENGSMAYNNQVLNLVANQFNRIVEPERYEGERIKMAQKLKVTEDKLYKDMQYDEQTTLKINEIMGKVKQKIFENVCTIVNGTSDIIENSQSIYVANEEIGKIIRKVKNIKKSYGEIVGLSCFVDDNINVIDKKKELEKQLTMTFEKSKPSSKYRSSVSRNTLKALYNIKPAKKDVVENQDNVQKEVIDDVIDVKDDVIEAEVVPQVQQIPQYEPEYCELVRIELLKKLPSETVYDLVLEDKHNFIANYAVVHNCNLVSLCLPKYIETDDSGKRFYNFNKLMDVTRVAVRNLNKVINKNYYPTPETKVSNMRHRPIGIGVQGLADVYNLLGHPWESEEASRLNKMIFETIYYGALDESKELAKKEGHYESFIKSPFSEGILQYDLWGLSEKDLIMDYDWIKLKTEITKYGTRNSLLTALMPTASTAQIMGNYEGFEPYMSNIFVRTTLAGEFIVINQNLIEDLKQRKLWNEDMRKLIIINNGSIQNIKNIPKKIKNIYKTAFEIKSKNIIKQSLERGPFIDQSQSMNLFMASPNFTKLTSGHFYGWKNGIKTGMYYLRSKSAVNPINFGIDIDDIKRLTEYKTVEDLLCATYGITLDKDKVNEEILSTYGIGDKEPKRTDADSDKKETRVCKWSAGKKIEDCLVCGS
uniref:ribonucleoside-diphosphate reductase n=1 Tax=viral metagenome TaxID=1070528 RepID=A0A6C0ECF2_9ZZZZ